MDPNLLLGFTFVLLGAICGGSFGLPSKFVGKDTPWEVLWGPFFFFVTILIPLTLGPVAVKGFFEIVSTAGLSGVAWILVFGLLWGFGSMTLALASPSSDFRLPMRSTTVRRSLSARCCPWPSTTPTRFSQTGAP